VNDVVEVSDDFCYWVVVFHGNLAPNDHENHNDVVHVLDLVLETDLEYIEEVIEEVGVTVLVLEEEEIEETLGHQ